MQNARMSAKTIAIPITRGGFSYIELMVSIAILALLAGSATPYLEKTIQRKKEAELRQELRQIRNALDAYKLASDQGKIQLNVGDSGYPKRLEDLVNGVVDMSDPQKRRLRFLRKLPADPMFSEAGGYGRASINNSSSSLEKRPEDTWGKRSYDSDAENPQEGVDVFDVYSMSEQKGLNGIPYRLW